MDNKTDKMNTKEGCTMILCIDCGLTNGKVMLFTEEGNCCASEQFSTPLRDDFVDTQALEHCLCASIKTLLHHMDAAPDKISCISVSGHGNGLYALTDQGVLPMGYSSMTTRQAQSVPDQEQLFPLVLQSCWSGQPLSILAWLKQSKPDDYRRIKTILFCKDLLRWFMTGVAATEQTDASAAGLLNVKTGTYDKEILRLYGLEDAWEKLPPLHGSAEILGRVTESFSARTGLPAGTPVLGGLFDVNSCMLGAGVIQTNRFSMTAGTWGINAIPAAAPVAAKNITQCCQFYGEVPYVCIDSAPTSCANLEWYAKKMMHTDDFSALSQMVQEKPSEPELFFLPYLYAPMDLPQLSGGFVGLKPHHDQIDLLRAVFEGIVFEHRRRMEKLQSNGLDAESLVLSGGASGSPVFAQLFADICNKEVLIPQQSQAGAMGGVLLSQMAAGAYASLSDAVASLVRYKQSCIPTHASNYEQKYQRFCDLICKR